MDRILDNEIQYLLDEDVGDSGRLEFIRRCLQNDKPLYNSDRKFLVRLLVKYSADEFISQRLDYLNPKFATSQTIIERPRSKMNNGIKILIVIGITIGIYFLIHPSLILICDTIFDDASSCLIFSDLHHLTAINISSGTIWNTGDGIGEWTGTVEGMESQSGFLIRENLGFIFFFIIIPSFVILTILANKRKNLP